MKDSRNLSILPIITARGGSKGLPGKNVYPINGIPLIGYSINAANNSNYLTSKPLVSTDDTEIANLAINLGATAPFIRPPELSTDEISLYPVLIHALKWIKENDGCNPEYILLLQPTSPLRTSKDIDSAIQLALENDADSVVSVCTTQHHPYLSKTIVEGKLKNFLDLDIQYHRRQDLPQSYVLNGAIYLVKSDILIQHDTFYTDNTYGYVMPRDRSIDVDSQLDMDIAEFMLMRNEQHRHTGQTEFND